MKTSTSIKTLSSDPYDAIFEGLGNLSANESDPEHPEGNYHVCFAWEENKKLNEENTTLKKQKLESDKEMNELKTRLDDFGNQITSLNEKLKTQETTLSMLTNALELCVQTMNEKNQEERSGDQSEDDETEDENPLDTLLGETEACLGISDQSFFRLHLDRLTVKFEFYPQKQSEGRFLIQLELLPVEKRKRKPKGEKMPEKSKKSKEINVGDYLFYLRKYKETQGIEIDKQEEFNLFVMKISSVSRRPPPGLYELFMK